MGRNREWWRTFLTGVGFGLMEDDGPNSNPYTVKMRLSLERDENRMLFVELTPDQADNIAASLRENAANVRRENKRYRPPTKRVRNAPDTARTPENLAYVNGRHSVTAGWSPLSFEDYCGRFHVTPSAENADRLYQRFLDGRRDQTNEKGSE